MGKPAAVIGSMHVCPKVTEKVPHVGGPVVVGSPNVKIGGLPAARKGDKLVCVGPPDTVSEGSSSVFINQLEWETGQLTVARLLSETLRF